MKWWAMPCRASQDGQVMVERSTECGPLEKGMANCFSMLALRTPWTVWTVGTVLAFPRCAGRGYAWPQHAGHPCGGFSCLATGSRRTGYRSFRALAQQLGLAGSRAWLQQLWCMGLVAHGMWNPPRPRIKPTSPELAGRFPPAVWPGKSDAWLLFHLPLILHMSCSSSQVLCLAAFFPPWFYSDLFFILCYW